MVPEGPLKMWKGLWSPLVFKSFFNWKELLTLELSLFQIHEENDGFPFSEGPPACPPVT